MLVADIGGTNARFALWRADTASGQPSAEIHSVTYQGKDYPEFEHALATFLSESAVKANPPRAAAFAVAGAVATNACAMTNLPWIIDGSKLAEQFGFRWGCGCRIRVGGLASGGHAAVGLGSGCLASGWYVVGALDQYTPRLEIHLFHRCALSRNCSTLIQSLLS